MSGEEEICVCACAQVCMCVLKFLLKTSTVIVTGKVKGEAIFRHRIRVYQMKDINNK